MTSRPWRLTASAASSAAVKAALGLVLAGCALHVYALAIDAGGARIAGLLPYLLAGVALLITRRPVVALASLLPLSLVDALFAFDVFRGQSGGVADLGHGWAMAHYVKLLVMFPICTWIGVSISETPRDSTSPYGH